MKKKALGPVRPVCSSAMPAHKRLPLDVKKNHGGERLDVKKHI